MTRTALGILFALLVAASVAWGVGGPIVVGLALGFASGAAASGLGLAWQGHVLRTRPERALQANILSFLACLALLLIGGVALRFGDGWAGRANWGMYLIAFGAAVAFIPPLGLVEITRSLRRTKSP